MQSNAAIQLSKRSFNTVLRDPVKTAKAIHLRYVSNTEAGYTRKRRGDSFYYTDGTQKVKDPFVLERIRKLVIPPAWENVWICKQANGHLQVTGIDKLGRKQYRYHPDWNAIRNQTKFFRLLAFGQQLPQMRNTLGTHLSLQGFPREKILAAVVSLIERTNIRIGNNLYEKLYGSFGLTTMKNRHVQVQGNKITFSFKGKKGIQHNIGISSPKLARIVKACKEIPGKELFEYQDENGVVHNIDSGMVNEYIHELSGGDFSAKDFRTWAGSVQALLAFKELGDYENEADKNHKLPAAFDAVAKQLGNTRSVCKKYYVHPVIVSLYEEKKLGNYLTEIEKATEKQNLAPEEQILMQILEKEKL